MTLLLQISDPHFGTERPEVVEALLRLAAHEQPDLAVLSGDITQRARRTQFAAARAFVDRLGATPSLVIPGNHDIPLFNLFARVLHPYANHRRVFGANLEPQFESRELLVIGLNTTRPSRHTDGEVSAEQIECVARRLEHATPLQLRVVVTHQPVASVTADDTHNLLHGREPAIRRWAQAGVDLIVGGHIHLPYVLPLAERMQIARPVWAVQAGTAVSTRIRGQISNSVNLIRYDAGARKAVIARYDFDEDGKAFVPVLQHELTLARPDETLSSNSAHAVGPS
ncbi:metallophosphoesterase [Paraburkholderia sp. Tr-20389]|uniref:metallophosphoesterase family protein n=1 Tax=Paraburkholderia sp. Tr-20389 TaxID=2703903 RepID=UPI0019825DE5|nr:metallophosphoesterase [Paraburkholderia sp. Tr-20389]MBN3751381.1 metallophosphoesterase [Paraburkholderia sp. Tr-20389]